MEDLPRYSKQAQLQIASAIRQRRSGYEPSDAETDWPDSPTREVIKNDGDISSSEGENGARIKSGFNLSHRRKPSKSPYRPRGVDGDVIVTSQRTFNRNVSPFAKPETRKWAGDDDTDLGSELFSKSEKRRVGGNNHNHRFDSEAFTKSEQRRRRGNDFLESESVLSPFRKQNSQMKVDGFGRVNEKSNRSRRAISAPRDSRVAKYENKERKKMERKMTSPLPRSLSRDHKNDGPSVGEINEMVANVKVLRTPVGVNPMFDSTDSISPGDIFFSRDYAAFIAQNSFPKTGAVDSGIPNSNQDAGKWISSSTVVTQTNTVSSSAISRQSSNLSESRGMSSVSAKNFTANRQKSHLRNPAEAWFSCIKKGNCRSSKKSPERGRPIDEALYIEKAVVVERLRQFWADKHQPVSLDGFICHKQEALLLKRLAADEALPHILLKGPPGSGKKTLAMALLREVYGDSVSNISHNVRYFQIQETRPVQVVVPISSSPHHIELNVHLERNSRYALMALVKQISTEYAAIPEISRANLKADHKVLVLYGVDKASQNTQHLIKWIMDCYSESCKLILCCEDDTTILESVKNNCRAVSVEAPVTHEVMEVLIQIARKEDLELSMSFAAKIATKSKQNLRQAIMALEACNANNYPFSEDQPIPMGWEEALLEIAAEILADPSPKRLFTIRGKLQKLLLDFVHPKLILQKLVEQFLRRVDASLRREVYYWHAYYDKRLPTGTNALLKLEEFVAKFMSIYRRSGESQYVR